MMHRHDNLYGDTAIMASLIRWRALKRLSREPEFIRGRILHGSDYPFPPACRMYCAPDCCHLSEKTRSTWTCESNRALNSAGTTQTEWQRCCESTWLRMVRDPFQNRRMRKSAGTLLCLSQSRRCSRNQSMGDVMASVKSTCGS